MRLPSRDSATGKGVWTAVQAVVGLMVAVVALPEFGAIVETFAPEALIYVPTIIGVVSFLNNFLRKEVPNY